MGGTTGTPRGRLQSAQAAPPPEGSWISMEMGGVKDRLGTIERRAQVGAFFWCREGAPGDTIARGKALPLLEWYLS